MKHLKPHPPRREFASPQCIHDGNGEEAENQTTTAGDTMIRPSIISIGLWYLADDRPRKDAEDVGNRQLVHIPARLGCEELL